MVVLVLTCTVETTAQVESPEFRCLPHEGLVVRREGLWKEGGVMLPPGHVPPGQGLPRGQWPVRSAGASSSSPPPPHDSAQCHFLQGASLMAPATFPGSSAFMARSTQLGRDSALQSPGLSHDDGHHSPAGEGPFPKPHHRARLSLPVPPSCSVPAAHPCPLDQEKREGGAGLRSPPRLKAWHRAHPTADA